VSLTTDDAFKTRGLKPKELIPPLVKTMYEQQAQIESFLALCRLRHLLAELSITIHFIYVRGG
jgi:hypothetical protein